MASSPEVTQARIALNQSLLMVEDARRQQIEALSKLATAVGLTSKSLDRITIASRQLLPPSALPSNELQQQALLNRADVLAALSEYAASQSALQLDIAHQYPDLHLGPGYSWDQGASKWLLGFSVALPVMNQNEGPIAEAQARRIQAMTHFNVTQARAISEMDLAVAGYRSSGDKLEAVNMLLRIQTAQLNSVQASFKAGETDRLALVGAQLALTQIELSRVDALAKTEQAHAALEAAIQAPLMASAKLVQALETSPRPPKETIQ